MSESDGSLNELEELIKLVKKHGISHYKTNNIEFRFAVSNQTPPDEVSQNIAESIKALSKEDMPPDDQMLFAHTDSFEGDLDEETKKMVDQMREPTFNGS